jgi:protein gp37
MAKRLKRMGQARYQLDGDPRTSGPGFGVQIHPDVLQVPLHWSRPRLIFVDSMSDLFHAKVPVPFLRQVFDVMVTPHHTYQILTKRSSRLLRLAAHLRWPSSVWMGVSVEDSRQLSRVTDLVTVSAAVRFISAEPLLGPLQLDLSGIDWVIAGGKAGAGTARSRATGFAHCVTNAR